MQDLGGKTVILKRTNRSKYESISRCFVVTDSDLMLMKLFLMVEETLWY
jgi:hypothetical protein